MGVIRVIDLLMDVSYALIEPVINTTLGANIASGVNLINVPALLAQKLYVGAQMVCGVPGGNIEVITCSAIGATSFTANFANAHATTDPLLGATFPSGQLLNPLYTQTEMLGYVADIQNNFLVDVQPVFTTATVAIDNTTRYWTQPTDCIRIERISINGVGLRNTTQSNLDLNNPNWQSQSGTPTRWFQDQVNNTIFGFNKLPDANYNALLYYAQRGPRTLGFLDTFVVPDVFTYALKYGVLSRAWGKDGEAADPQRAALCQKKFDFVVYLALLFMRNAQTLAAHQSNISPFKPMARPVAGA